MPDIDQGDEEGRLFPVAKADDDDFFIIANAWKGMAGTKVGILLGFHIDFVRIFQAENKAVVRAAESVYWLQAKSCAGLVCGYDGGDLDQVVVLARIQGGPPLADVFVFFHECAGLAVTGSVHVRHPLFMHG